MSEGQPFAATASYSHSLHGGLDGCHYSGRRHDQSSDNNMLDFAARERALLCVHREPKVPVAKVFGFCKSRNENIRHNGRLGQQHSHSFLPSRLFLFVLVGPQGISNRLFGQLANQILVLTFVTLGLPQDRSRHGFQAVNRGVL